MRFPANQGNFWANGSNVSQGVRRAGFIQVDTDNDLRPDTFLPGTTSNFAAGASSRPGRADRGAQQKLRADYVYDEFGCHIEPPTEGHCPEIPY